MKSCGGNELQCGDAKVNTASLPGHQSIHWAVNQQLFLCCSMASLSPALLTLGVNFSKTVHDSSHCLWNTKQDFSAYHFLKYVVLSFEDINITRPYKDLLIKHIDRH